MKKKIFYLLGLVTLLTSLSSCEEKTICDLSTDAPLRANFYSILNDTLEVDTLVESITVVGVGNSDSLVEGLSSQNGVNFTLNPFEDLTSFHLILDGVSDTITISYDRELELVSELCGFITTFDIRKLQSTYHYIDSVALINTKVRTENEQHVKIYF